MARKQPLTNDQWTEIGRRSGYQSRLLANELQVTTRQLQRYTQKIFQRSPQAWLNDLRLRDAVALLQEHRVPRYVAVLVGYKTVSHFSREFRRVHGLSPNAFLSRPTVPSASARI